MIIKYSKYWWKLYKNITWAMHNPDPGLYFQSRIGYTKEETDNEYHVAAANPLTGWARGPMLTAHTSPLPPPHMGSRVGQPAFQSRGRSNQPALTIYLSCIYSYLSPNKASILRTAVRYCTCSYRYLYGVGRYGRVCTCTATDNYFKF